MENSGRHNPNITRFSLLTSILFLCSTTSPVRANNPILRAILFYLLSCPHCRKVISGSLPSLVEKYGDRIIIFAINTQTEEGNQLFVTALEHYEIPWEHAGVPMLVVGETLLIRSMEIPEMFPGIIEN